MKKKGDATYYVAATRSAQRELDSIPCRCLRDQVVETIRSELMHREFPPDAGAIVGLPDHYMIPAGDEYTVFYALAPRMRALFILGVLRVEDYNVH